jgi:hypothetical protein
MTPLVDELKVRARLRLNAARRAGDAGGLALRDCLHEAARAVGFADWEHARRVLGGAARPGDDLGSFWHAPQTAALLNPWFARHAEAAAALAQQPGQVLLPFRRQFLLAGPDYLRALGLDPADPAWWDLGHDAVRGYGSAAWLALAMRRLRADPARFTPGRRPA